MKKIFLLAALALTMAACSSDDNIMEQPAEVRGIPFTATISGSSTTRALSDPDGEGKIQAAWAENEEVALVYEVGGTTKVTKATVTAVSDGNDGKTEGTATITANLDANVTNGTAVTLIYPYSMVVDEGDHIGQLKDGAFKGQNGALTGDGSISAKYDLRQGTGKISLATATASLKENVTMASQICIWKLTTKNGTDDLNVSEFSAFANGYTAQATLTSTNEFYLAVPAGTSGLSFLATGAGGSTTYIYNKASVTLAPSTYYQSTVSLTQQNVKTITSTDEEVTLNDGDIVSGTGGANTVLKIADKATVTLNGLTNSSITKSAEIAGIECLGDATIILADGSTNTLKGRWWHPAVFIHSGKTLTIRGGGTLVADDSGGPYGAGIGGGYLNDCGNIVIEGGNITAMAGAGAGIGGGNGHSCGNITITGGNITATGNDGAGIGSGDTGSCSDITITGGTVNATGGAYAAGIGSGKSGDAANTCGDITIKGSARVTAKGGQEAAGIGCGDTDTAVNTCGAITISASAIVTATGGSDAAGIGSGHAYNAVNTCGDITISGSAHVTATGGDYAAGIGSGNAYNAVNTCGNIGISGSAHVTAKGGSDAAGIGSGNGNNNTNYAECGAISITGGTASATGGNRAAGIGSGSNGKYASITIGSGITGVTATRSNDYWNVPIGKGDDDQGSGAITIDGEATSDNMTKGWESLPTFPNLKVVISDTPVSNGTWTITHK